MVTNQVISPALQLAHPTQPASRSWNSCPALVPCIHIARTSSTVLPRQVQALCPNCCRGHMGGGRGVISPALLPSGLAHLHPRSRVCVALSPALQLVRVWASSPTLVTTGPTLSPAADGNGRGRGGGGGVIFPSFMLPHDGRRWVNSPAFMASGMAHLSVSLTTSPALVCCPDDVHTHVRGWEWGWVQCRDELSPEG